MSAEARRASRPPRPAAPPRPAQPPTAAAGDTAAPDRRPPGAPGPADRGEAAARDEGAAAGPAGEVLGADAPAGRGDAPAGPRPGTGSPADRSRFPDSRSGTGPAAGPAAPPPPRASARFPDAPPAVGRRPRREGPDGAARSAVPPLPGRRPAPSRPDHRPPPTPPRPGHDPVSSSRPDHDPASSPRRPGTPAETSSETTARLRPVPAQPPRAAADDARPAPAAPGPALPWSTAGAPGGTAGAGRPLVSFGEPEGYDEHARPRPLGGRARSRTVAAAACLVLGLGLIGGAVTGDWLIGDFGEGGARGAFATAGGLWHSVPVDRLFPPTVQGRGAGPGGADRTWTRIAVAPDSGCQDAFDPLLSQALAPVGCRRLLRATYTDATESHVTTVGLLFTKADAAAMRALDTRFARDGLDRRTDLMPLPYAAKDTAAAGFGPGQRASWTVSVLTDAPVVVYAVSGWADGRTVDDPQPAKEAMASGATTAPAQAGLGHEARGLADRIERGLRRNVRSATEQPS
ncbi:hypothetical protein ACIBAI_19445 [Streptomyces sp. NPDC051041]|uniref:hypothetical protein n=1 Tax=Streptomyces sp. NPDC051041 TaxID=3365640 RepID=UPI003788BFBA